MRKVVRRRTASFSTTGPASFRPATSSCLQRKKHLKETVVKKKNNEKKHWRLQTNKQTKMLTNRPSLRYSQNMWSWNEELTFPAERWWAGWWWGHPWKPLSSFDQGRSLTENQIPKLFSLLRSNVEGESIKALKVVKSESETKHPQSRWECEMGGSFQKVMLYSPAEKVVLLSMKTQSKINIK